MFVLTKTTQCLEDYYVHAYEAWKRALAKTTDVVNYGNGYPNFLGWATPDKKVYEELGRTPDVELWCGGPGNKKPQYIDGKHILPEAESSVPKLILLTDYWEIVRDSNIAAWKKREEQLARMGVVGYFSFYSQTKEYMQRKVGTRFDKFVLFPYVTDDRFFEITTEPMKWDVNLQMCVNGNYPFRSAVVKGLELHKDITRFRLMKDHLYKNIAGDKDPLNSIFKQNDPTANYAKLVNRCRVTITCGYTKYSPQAKAWGLSSEDLFLARFGQALASRSILMCPPITSDHMAPIVDGVHYVAVDRNNYLDKLKYYLSHESERKEMASVGRQWARENVSESLVARVIADQLSEVIK